MNIFKLCALFFVVLGSLFFSSCDKDEPTAQRLASTVWSGEIWRNNNGVDEIEYTVNLFVKEDNKLDLVVVAPDNSLEGRFENTPYTLKGKVFTMNVEEGYWPRVMLRQSWFVVRLTDKEFNLEMDGGYRKMFLKRNR